MASSPPSYEWRLTGKLEKPKRPNPLFFYRFDMFGNVRDAIWSLIWKSFCALFGALVFAGLVEYILSLFTTTSTYFWISFCLLLVIFGGIGVWLTFYDDWSTAKHSHEQDMEKYRRAVNDYQEKLSLLKQKHPFPIIGHKQFRRSVERVLDELQACAPHRYSEVIEYFPKAEYKSDLRSYTEWEKKISGRSDGYFATDGSGNIHHQDGWYTKNDYGWFRYVFLHEVGHNVYGKKNNDHSEEAADGYANRVLQELE